MKRRPQSKTLYEGRFIKLVHRDGWEYVRRTNASGVVVVVAVTQESRLLLVEQFRPPVGRTVIELPAGLAGDAGRKEEALVEAARRELEEETGYRPGDLTKLTVGPSSAGLTDEMITFYLAEQLERIGPGGGEGDENITVHEVPLVEVNRWLQQRQRGGYMLDYKVYVGLAFLLSRLGPL